MTTKDKSETKLDVYELTMLETAIQFNIDRIESMNDKMHEAEKQSMKALKDLKSKIQIMKHDNE